MYKFLLVHCHECGVTSPRESAELARASGRTCLICGAQLERDGQADQPARSGADKGERQTR
jgi:hypothetical protein